LIRHRWDVGVLWRLRRLFLQERLDGIVTVGAGDKMFWGRLAARACRLPVVISALHSTGWPDGVGTANRWLTPWTDAFVAVADAHGKFLHEFEGFPASKVRVIPNGVDTDRFVFSPEARRQQRLEWGWDESVPVVGVVAALRPEKNLRFFLQAASVVLSQMPEAGFVVVGAGPEESVLRDTAAQLGIAERVRFLGLRKDTPDILAGIDVFALSSDNEASPVSILEALSVQRPVVATQVGSVPETVQEGVTGRLVPPGEVTPMANAWLGLLREPEDRAAMGQRGRDRVVARHSLAAMTEGYMDLIETLFWEKQPAPRPSRGQAAGISVRG
jgi:glycosyltransferase involved in cell wall biosynthesis